MKEEFKLYTGNGIELKKVYNYNDIYEPCATRGRSLVRNGNIRQLQSDKLKTLKAKKNNEKVANCLKKIKARATNNENLMPVVIDSVENFRTLGEISDTLREVFEEHR